MDLFKDDLEVLDIIEYGFPRRVHNRRNYYQEMDKLSFFKRFRLHKNTVSNILQQIEGELEYPDNRTIKKLSCAIARLFPIYVKMPEQQKLILERNAFYNVARFPRFIGLVDGTHVKIQSPGNENAEVYRNRKSYFSINVQVVGNADLKFSDVVARWPGSTHDATIFAKCTLRVRFENYEYENCLLIGDSGYPLRNYFITPLINPLITQAEQLYNESLIRTRNEIERHIGLWKRRFPV